MRCFYRPHKRVQFDNSVVDPYTGEVKYPPSRTKQEFAAECDINNILKQFSRTGMLTHVNAKAAQGMYMDLPDPVDFQAALAMSAQAHASFASLPSKLRDRFHNDPAEFLAFMSDPANLAEAQSLGLVERGPPSAPADAESPAGNPPPSSS